MGVIFSATACKICGYVPRGPLFYHGGKLGLFRGLATCQTCHELVSISPDTTHIPNEFMQMFGGIEAYQAHVDEITARFNLTDRAVNMCPVCGSHELIHHNLWEAYSAKQPIDLPCPRSETGQIHLEKVGMWD